MAFKQEGKSLSSQRWRSYFDRVTGRPERIVLFGAGQFGTLAVERLRRAGCEPICFSDNSPARWGTHVESLEVISPDEAVARFSDHVTFVVTVFNGSAVRSQLRRMGCKYVLSAAALFWKFPDQFMPDLGIDSPELIVDNERPVRQCFERLGDERSRQEFCDQLRWRYWLDPEFLTRQEDPHELYFPDELVTPNPDEIIVDCGAFDGDVIRSLIHRDRAFAHLFALEPDRQNQQRLAAFISSQPESLRDRVTVWPYAVSDVEETATFTGSGDVASRIGISDDAQDGYTVQCRTLDSLDWSSTPTYIKMDIEGAEPRALAGGAGLLKQRMPVLAICLYHRSQHLWEIPNSIYTIQPGYSLFLRRYAEDCWEQVCYAIPKERLSVKVSSGR